MAEGENELVIVPLRVIVRVREREYVRERVREKVASIRCDSVNVCVDIGVQPADVVSLMTFKFPNVSF